MKWREIWQRRAPAEGSPVRLQDLIDLDGFDAGAGRITAGFWRVYAGAIGESLGLVAGNSVYEVGCGAGALLFALREQYGIRIGGADVSPNLVRAARTALPEGDFEVLEAADLPPDPRYDYVVSNSVFHYFPDLGHASRVLERMIAKSNRAAAVLDVPDLSWRATAERVRRERLSAEAYETKYSGLPHLYFEYSWFTDFACSRSLDCRPFSPPLPSSAQSGFRFGAVLTRG